MMVDGPPVQLGDRVTLRCDRLAYGGDGVGRYEGLTVFVAGVCPGETVAVEIEQVRPRFARGRLVEVVEASPERVAPPCPYYGECGGCQLQHLDYPAQVASKTVAVRDAMARLGRLPEVEVRECVPCPLPVGYRNKIELAATTDERGRLTLAYHPREEGGPLVPIRECLLALPEINGLLEAVEAWLRETGWPAYDEEDGSGLIREVGLRYSPTTREATLLLTSGRRDLPRRERWFDELGARLPELVGLRHRARTRASQTPDGRPVGERLGRPLRVLHEGLSLRVSPDSFFQVNEWLRGDLVAQVRAALEPQRDDRVADLYAGVGLFGLSVAREVARVVLLEVDRDAADDALANVRFNELGNVEVEQGQVEQRLSAIGREVQPTKIIVDPPRQGLSEAVLRITAGIGAQRIAYVACDPTTMARDLARLVKLGYAVDWVQPLDLFPQTYHVECVAALHRV